MTEPLADTWHNRDLLVLRAAVSLYDETLRVVRGTEIIERTGLSEADVLRAAVALNGDGLLEARNAKAGHVLAVGRITGEARRRAGSWPSAETIADRLLATLNELADNTTDPVEKGRLRKAAEAVGSLTRDTLVSVAGAAAGVAMQ